MNFNTNMTTRKWSLAALGVILLGGSLALLEWPGAAQATPALNFNSDATRSFFEKIRVLGGLGRERELEDARVAIIAKDPSDVYIVNNTVAPGGYSGWHTHPGPSVVLVKSGTATVYDGDDPNCLPVRYPAGTGFIDAGGGHVHMVRNESATDPLVTTAFQIIPAGQARRIDAPNPGYCSF